LGRCFPPLRDWFAPQEHPIMVAKAENIDQAQGEKHVFQGFCILSSNYLLQGKPFNEICNIR